MEIKRMKQGWLFALLASCTVTTVGFTSQAASIQSKIRIPIGGQEEIVTELQANILQTVPESLVISTADTVNIKLQEIKEEAERREQEAREQAEREAQARQQAVEGQAGAQELLAAIIFCEAGNQPYEGQVAVGAVVINRVNSGAYPNSIEEVIYQPGQFGPASTGWLDSVRSSGGYTAQAMEAAADALNGANPIGDCLYFDQGGYGMQIGDHYFH